MSRRESGIRRKPVADRSRTLLFLGCRAWVWRELVLRTPGLRTEQILINEFPKSGATWLGRMLRDLTGRQFADNRLPTSRRGIIKHHSLHDYRISRRVIMWRDPRDIMVSLYHHSFFVHEDYPANRAMVDLTCARYRFEDYEDIQHNLPVFVRDQFIDPVVPRRFTLVDFATKWRGADAVHVRYEDLRSDTAAVLAATAAALGEGSMEGTSATEVVSNHRIVRSEGIEPSSKSFVRRGKVGGFVDEMSKETADFIFESCLPWVHELGYRREAGAIADAPWTS